MRERQLGSTFDCCPIVGHAELGNGVQEMVSGLQDSHVLRHAERAQAEAHRLDEGQCIPCVYYIVQAGRSGSPEFPAKEVEVLDIGRSAKYQKFQVTTMANAVEFLHGTTVTADRHTAAEQSDGAVVVDAFPNAARFPIASRVQGMVLESNDWNDRRQFGVQ